MTVPTLTGQIGDDELGATLMHEHIFGLSPEIHWNWPDMPEGWDRDEQIEIAAGRLDEVADAGIDSIVDMTVLGLGRHVPSVAAVAERTRVRIVAATGIYTYDQLPPYFANKGPGSLFGGPDRMVELFVRDLTEGMAGTGLRAGMLKCCVDRAGITPGIDRLLSAVAEAHHRTGAPVTVHTDSGTRRGLDALAALTRLGVDADRVVIGHAGDSTDLDYLRRLVDAGAWLGMDRFGVETTPFADRVEHSGGAVPGRPRRSAGAFARRVLVQRPRGCRAGRPETPELPLLPRFPRRHPGARTAGRHAGPDRPDAPGQPTGDPRGPLILVRFCRPDIAHSSAGQDHHRSVTWGLLGGDG